MEQQFFSRYTDTTLVRCEECGWVGQIKDCIHTYRDDGTTNPDGSPTGEVEPVDECPSCESEELWEVEQQ